LTHPSPENVLFAAHGRWAGRAVAIDALVQRRPPGGIMSQEVSGLGGRSALGNCGEPRFYCALTSWLKRYSKVGPLQGLVAPHHLPQDRSCEKLTELALNDGEVAGALLRQALKPAGPIAARAVTKQTAAAFQEVRAPVAKCGAVRRRLPPPIAGHGRGASALVSSAQCTAWLPCLQMVTAGGRLWRPPRDALMPVLSRLASPAAGAGHEGCPGRRGHHQGPAGDDV
jgi:hypothetical protein